MHPELSVANAAGAPDHSDTQTLRMEPLRRCRVMVVDDDELVRAQLAALLNLAGYEVYCAGSGQEALRLLSTTFCQIVLTDWQMPDMDGVALCRNLRLRDAEGYIYILMLTVRGSGSDILSGLDAGADDYIVKGAPAEEIVARVEVGRRITHVEHSLRTSNQEHRRLSLTDPLTGVRNRRYLMKYLPRELDRSRRHEHPLAILSCDIDRFKRVNDCFGHEAGDEVLRAFAERSASCLRYAIDWIARAGGEEFVVVLPVTNSQGATCVAMKLRHAFSAERISTSCGPLVVTVSIGIAALETADELASVSAVALLRRADTCLYISKKLGRNRATAAAPPGSDGAMSDAPAGGKNEVN
jgi:two-component system, cell cycle response regulator